MASASTRLMGLNGFAMVPFFLLIVMSDVKVFSRFKGSETLSHSLRFTVLADVLICTVRPLTLNSVKGRDAAGSLAYERVGCHCVPLRQPRRPGNGALRCKACLGASNHSGKTLIYYYAFLRL